MKKILSCIGTCIIILMFLLILLAFHPLQWLSLKLGGYAWHKKTVDYLNFCLIKNLWLIGVRGRFSSQHVIPENRPVIIVANHQSLYDIPMLAWYLRKYHVKFVAKIELKKMIPSVSFNLRHGGSILIDRKNPKQSLPALKQFGEYIEKHQYAACIFPEGTRGKNGEPGRFNMRGLGVLIESSPSAVVLPVTINNTWKLQGNRLIPIPFGEPPSCTVHAPIEPRGRALEAVFNQTEKVIRAAVKGVSHD